MVIDTQEPSILFEGVFPRYGNGNVVRFSCRLPSSCEGPLDVRVSTAVGVPAGLQATVVRDEIRLSNGGDGCRLVDVSVTLKHMSLGCKIKIAAENGGERISLSRSVSAFELRRTRSDWMERRINAQDDPEYGTWFAMARTTEWGFDQQRLAVKEMPFKPLVSVISPIFRTPEAFLREMIDSVLGQTYDNLELVLVNVSGDCPEVDKVLASYDDARIRVVTAENADIATNTNVGIAASRGDYVAFVDHDDFIEPDTLYRYIETITSYPDCDLLFCDEDLWGPSEKDPRFYFPKFKPSWNLSMLRCHNYVCHMLMVSRYALDHTERSKPEVAGAQDYDLALRTAEIARRVCHVPRMLYHWRCWSGSTASNGSVKPYAHEAGRLALQGHFERIGTELQVEGTSSLFVYRAQRNAPDPGTVSIVVPDLGRPVLLEACLSSVAEHTRDSLYEVLVVGSQPVSGTWDEGRVRYVCCEGGTYASLVNAGVAAARGDRVVVLGEACTVQREGWLPSLTDLLCCRDVGCVGSAMVDADGLVASCGMSVGADGSVDSMLRRLAVEDSGYMSMLENARDCSALAMDCISFRKDAFAVVGGFDESYKTGYAAIDFCLRLRESGKLVVVAPYDPIWYQDLLACAPYRLDCDAVEEDRVRLVASHPRLAKGDEYHNRWLDARSGLYQLPKQP